MFQGETITTEICCLPVDVSDITSARIQFHTATRTILEKSLEDCVINGQSIFCTLTQEETLRFPCGPVARTIIVVCHDGSRFERTDRHMIVRSTAKKEAIL